MVDNMNAPCDMIWACLCLCLCVCLVCIQITLSPHESPHLYTIQLCCPRGLPPSADGAPAPTPPQADARTPLAFPWQFFHGMSLVGGAVPARWWVLRPIREEINGLCPREVAIGLPTLG